MPDQPTQSYQNHARWHVPFHFVLSPILLIHVGWSAKLAIQNPVWETIEGLLLAIALFVMAFLVRINPLRAQDRLIRLEEQLRYQRILPADLAAKASELPVPQIVALRFASDGELAGLVQRVLKGELSTSKEIKQAIQSWRGDYFRV